MLDETSLVMRLSASYIEISISLNYNKFSERLFVNINLYFI